MTEARTGRWPLPVVALVAFAAMCANDVTGTCMVVMESHYNAVLAAGFDVLEWFAQLVCSALAIGEIITHGWRTHRSLTIIAAVSAANVCGTLSGVAIAQTLR